jgi:hypothetical protein
MIGRSHSPPSVADADKPLRRTVALAYRTAREARLSHHDALDAAEAVYFEAHPDAVADWLAASAHINGMIASAIQDLHSAVRHRAVRVPYLGLAQGGAHQPGMDRRGCRTGCGSIGRGDLRVSPSRRLHPIYCALVWRTHRPLRPRRGDTRTTASPMVTGQSRPRLPPAFHDSWLVPDERSRWFRGASGRAMPSQERASGQQAVSRRQSDRRLEPGLNPAE